MAEFSRPSYTFIRYAESWKSNNTMKPAIYFGRRESYKGTHSFSFIKGKVIKYSTLYQQYLKIII